MKNFVKPRLLPNNIIKAGKNIGSLPAFVFILLFSLGAHAQKLVINPIGKATLTSDETAMLTRLIRYEAFVYNGLFDKLIPDSLPVVVNLYKNRKDFLQVRDAEHAGLTQTGFYLYRTGQCYVYKTDEYLSVIVHEASHLFMRYHNYSNVPRWINEGLSEFFEGLYLNEKGAVYVDPQQGRLQNVRKQIREGQVNLDLFVSPNNNAAWNTKSDIGNQYDMAYGIIYYLIKTGPEAVKLLLNLLRDGQTSHDALATLFGSFEFFENRIRLYYR